MSCGCHNFSHGEVYVKLYLDDRNIHYISQKNLMIVVINYLYRLIFIYLSIILVLNIKENNIIGR